MGNRVGKRLGIGLASVALLMAAGCTIHLGALPVSDLQVASSTSGTVTLSWDNPPSPFWTVMVRRAVGATPPSTASEGTLVWEGDAETMTDTGLAQGTTYSYAVFTSGALESYSPAVTVTATTGTTAQLDVGDRASCVRIDVGTVSCWGSFVDGPADADQGSKVPAQLREIDDAVAVGSGLQSYSCALIADGTVECWSTPVGSPWPPSSLVPTPVPGITTATALSADANHGCAVLADQTVRCWGSNRLGQLGDGSLTSSVTAVAVVGISTTVAVDVGAAHTCALLADGTISCWGLGASGQLGNGSTNVSQTTPVSVVGVSGATAVSAGSGHTCARLDDGTLRCWGDNWYGNLGDGTTTSSSTAVTVSGITTAASVSSGASFTCAVLGDGGVSCWGRNTTGTLGNGSTTTSSTPLPVPVPGISTAEAGQHRRRTRVCAARRRDRALLGRQRLGSARQRHAHQVIGPGDGRQPLRPRLLLPRLGALPLGSQHAAIVAATFWWIRHRTT